MLIFLAIVAGLFFGVFLLDWLLYGSSTPAAFVVGTLVSGALLVLFLYFIRQEKLEDVERRKEHVRWQLEQARQEQKKQEERAYLDAHPRAYLEKYGKLQGECGGVIVSPFKNFQYSKCDLELTASNLIIAIDSAGGAIAFKIPVRRILGMQIDRHTKTITRTASQNNHPSGGASVVGSGLVGGVLLGAVGAVLGAASAMDQNSRESKQSTELVSSEEVTDARDLAISYRNRTGQTERLVVRFRSWKADVSEFVEAYGRNFDDAVISGRKGKVMEL